MQNIEERISLNFNSANTITIFLSVFLLVALPPSNGGWHAYSSWWLQQHLLEHNSIVRRTIPNFEWPVVCYHFLLFVGGIYKLQSRHLDSGCSRCTYLLVVIAEALNGLVIVSLMRNENMCNGVAVWVVVYMTNIETIFK